MRFTHWPIQYQMIEPKGKLMDGVFIYRPPNASMSHEPLAQQATMGVKFATGVRILDPWGFVLIGMTKRERVLFRIKHPVVYTKRGLRKLYRTFKSLFIKERMIPCIQPKDGREDEPR